MHVLHRFANGTKCSCKMLVAWRIRVAGKGPQLSDDESSLSNPLDTVSLLEIGLHSRITIQRYRGLAGQSRRPTARRHASRRRCAANNLSVPQDATRGMGLLGE